MVIDGRRRQKKLSCWLFFGVVCPLQYMTVRITRFLRYVMVRVFTCTVFIVFTMMWFECFLVPVEAGLFCRVSSVQLLWGRCARQLWGSTSASHSQVVVNWVWQKMWQASERSTRITNKKNAIFYQSTQRFDRWTLASLFTNLWWCFCFKDSKLLGWGDPRKEKWGRTQALSIVGECWSLEGGKSFSISVLMHFSLAPPTDRMQD